MEAWLERMYERHGANYLPRAIAGIAGIALVVVPAVATSVPSHYEGLSLGQYAVATALVSALGLIGVIGVILAMRPDVRALGAWRAGERDEETCAAAERAAFEIPRKAAFRLGIYMLFVVVPAGVLATTLPRGHLTPSEAALVTFGAIFAAIFGILVWYAIGEFVLRPIRLSLGLHERPAASPPVGLATRLRLGLLLFPMIVGIGVAGNLIERETDSLLAVYALSLVATAAGVIVLVPLLSSSVLGPIRDLIRGTRAVGAGDLETSVAITTDDELGELTASFNKMVDDLRRGAEELRTSRSRIVAASDEARRKVERDLHDGAQQHLALLDLKLGLLRRAVEREPAEVERLADETKEDLERALIELRDLAHGIYPSVLTNDGLPAALAEAAGRAPIPASVRSDGVGRYRPELEAAVYFCCLEALQNAAKYAGEEANASVRLQARNGRLSFEVSDDGRGFDPAAADESAGLQNMADRIGALGGELRVESSPGEGTKVAGSVPLGG